MDLLLYNGVIHTMDRENTTAAAVGVKDGKIVFVGSDREAEDLKCANRVDLQGKCVLPGFTDSHIHTITYAWYENCVKLHGCTSADEVIRQAKAFMEDREFGGGKWIIGRGWNHHKFDRPDYLTKQDLDRISTEIPIAFLRVCGHVCAVNSKALELICQLPEAQPVMSDIHKDTGVLMENAARLFFQAIPKFQKDELETLIQYAAEKLNACGITSIHSDDLTTLPTASKYEILDAYKELAAKGELNVRVYSLCSFSGEDLKGYVADGYRTGDGDECFKIGPVKIVMDGSLGGKTAAVTEAYAGTEDQYGVTYFTVDELAELVGYCRSNGLDVTVHTIGDRAVEMAVDAIGKTNETFGRDRRNGVLYVQLSNENAIEKMAAENVQAFVQPVFVGSDMDFAETVVKNPKSKKLYAWKSMVDAGINVSGSASSPVEPFDILQNIQYAVTREKLSGGPENGWIPEEKLTVEEAVRLFTTAGAYASYEETVKGSLECGKLADMVILSQDIFETEIHKIKDIQVEETILGGRTVYKRG